MHISMRIYEVVAIYQEQYEPITQHTVRYYIIHFLIFP